jgi:hypothetical protein
MKHVKLFEEFNEEGNSPQNDVVASKTYIYYITNSNEKEFKADVRDPDGKVILEIDSQDLSNDGLMKGKEDIQGLHQLLISKNKIKQGDALVPANSTVKAVSGGGPNVDFVPEINTNAHQELMKPPKDENEEE